MWANLFLGSSRGLLCVCVCGRYSVFMEAATLQWNFMVTCVFATTSWNLFQQVKDAGICAEPVLIWKQDSFNDNETYLWTFKDPCFGGLEKSASTLQVGLQLHCIEQNSD